ncbi:hypothetical protein ACHQM5_024922 [Ranunculus cassubicifolius]
MIPKQQASTMVGSINFLPIVMLVLLFGFSSAGKSDIPNTLPLQRVHVTLNNALTDHRQNLNIHCISADNDLHPQVVAFGQNYHFSFVVNFFGNTMFTCEIWWMGEKGVKKQAKDIIIYNYGRDKFSCAHNDCFWVVRPQGLFIVPKPHPEKLMYTWSSM